MEGPRSNPIVSRQLALWLYALATGAAIIGLIVNVTGVFGWTVDATAVGLIGVLLLVPIAEHVRKLKVGSVEAEFAEKVMYLDRRVTEFTDLATDPAEEAPAAAEPLARVDSTTVLMRAIYRIVWVDDNPEGNRLELAELQRRFDVVTATSTKEGLARVSESPDDTAVITDAVRVEGGRENFDAGLDLLQALRERYPAIPVYVFCGQGTVESYAEPLEQAGPRLITANFTELARMIRSDARVSFEAEIAATLQELGSVVAQSDGVDFVITLEGTRIGVEAKDYRRTPKPDAINRVMELLGEAIEAGRIDKGVVVAPRDVFIPSQRQRVPAGVRLIAVSRLHQTLNDLKGGAE